MNNGAQTTDLGHPDKIDNSQPKDRHCLFLAKARRSLRVTGGQNGNLGRCRSSLWWRKS